MGNYVIEGGQAGKERLSLIAEVLQPTTAQLFAQAGLRPGMRALDVGCGGGAVTLELARRVGPQGHVTGLDFDETILALATQDAANAGLHNITFRYADATILAEPPIYDLVYARFLLSHLANVPQALAGLVRAARPGGLVVVEDIDLSGSFCYPPHQAFQRHLDLYAQVVRHNGGNSNTGMQLVELLHQAGLTRIGIHLVQPVFREGAGKRIAQVTLERISSAVTAAGLATGEDLAETVAELAAFAAQPNTIVSLPRIFQVWGVRAG
ncbi:MAG: methyltransferase domain-containing protein [Chloroflexaceae bacterium]|jgi:predicted O-methyltransferase YrrM|nr:methyltransferase domain-containing protein [Chloroflexaceae bacterium]